MSNPIDGAKRFKLFNELFLAFGNGKMVIKDLKKPNEHQTMFFRSNGVLDVHKTKEGTEKEYESLAKYDMIKSLAKIASNPTEFFQSMIDTIQAVRGVNFEESEFENLQVCPMMTLEEILPFLKITKRMVEMPIEATTALNYLDKRFPWKQAKDHVKENALVFDGDLPAGYIFKKNGKFLYLPVADIMNTPLVRFFDEKYFEKVEGTFSEKENELRKEFVRLLMEADSQEKQKKD